ncbi:MAG: prephenate dehydratase [Planctomycetota bacterium]|nr:prephenate dehydratase [Planctomycetota bacterium]
MAPKKRPPKSPATIRREILALDRSILEAVRKRAQLTDELASRSSSGSDAEAGIVKAANAVKGLPAEEGLRLLRPIEGYCQSRTQSQPVCFLGPDYSYSHLAAVRQFGGFFAPKPVQSIAAVFEEVSGGRSKFGVVPIENSTDGRIADTLTMFAQHQVVIYREVHLPIHHCLVGLGRLADIREIRSKSQALSQCRSWIDRTFSEKVQRIPATSSSDAAQDAKKLGKKVAAIASREAAEGLGLKVIEPDIEDQQGNITRFAIIVRRENPEIELPRKSGNDKSSIMFAIPHRPGSLADVINIFKRSRLNLTWIESFPKPGAFSEYTFFAEFQGHRDEAKVRNAMANLEKKTEEMTFLGSYPEFSMT